MDTYEIRILTPDQQTWAEACRKASDFAAIRYARNLAKQADHIEVWRGAHCVFTGHAGERSA